MSTRTISFNDGFSSATAPTGVDGISNWVTAQAYLVSDVVIQGSKIYECLIAHTAGVFATDLAAVKWGEISQGAVDHTALSNIGTNTHAQIDTHLANTSNPHSVTKAQVGLTNVDDTSDATKNAASVTLTNKTITGADFRTPTRLDMKQDTLANLTTYASTAADGQLCFATDTKATYVVKNSSLSSVGGAGAGINYILAPDADSGSTGWATYADAAATSPVDGTGGAPSSTFDVSASSPLRGTSSFLWTKSAANRQGEGFSYAFTIDASDKAKVLQCSFEYQAASGTFADNDMSVWIYDVTNAALIQPAPYLIKNSGIIEKFAVEFQTASNSTSYRLIVHTGSTSASAYTMKFDNFILGPQAKLYGSAIGEPVSVTPTGTWVTNTTYSGKVTRIGPFGKFDLKVTLSGAPTAATLDITLPSGYAIDTSKLENPNNNNFNLGTLNIVDNSAGVGYSGIVGLLNSTSIRLHPNGTAGSFTDIISPLNATTPITFASADIIDISFTVPIQGWSSSQVFSQDADVRVVAARYKISASTANSDIADVATEILDFDTKVIDTHGATTTGAAWKYTVKVPGIYKVSASQYFASASWTAGDDIQFNLYKNGSSYSVLHQIDVPATSTAAYQMIGSSLVECVAGDYLDLRMYQDGTGTKTLNTSSSYSYVDIEKISGPSQIAASESVICNYVTTAAQSIPSTTVTTVLFGTKINDSHGAYNTATGIFTAPMSGIYLVNASIDYTPTNTTGYRSVHAVGNSIDRTLLQNNAQSIYQQVAGVTTFRLLAGQTISVYALHNKGSAETLTASDAANYMSIYRIGSY